MKKRTLLSVFLFFLSTILFAQKFDFTFKHQEDESVLLYYQTYFGSPTESGSVLFSINPEEKKTQRIKLKKGYSVEFVGHIGNRLSFPVQRDVSSLSRKGENTISLIFPVEIPDREILSYKDLLNQMITDKALSALLNQDTYTIDQNLNLGTYILHNTKNNKVTTLQPTFWKNEDLNKQLNGRDYQQINRLKSGGEASLDVNVPIVAKFGAYYSKSNLMDIRWEVNNLHIEQWQASDMNYYDILNDSRNESFYNVVKQNLRNAPNDYKLYFVSQIELLDKVIISTINYQEATTDTRGDFSVPAPNMQIGVVGGVAYQKEKDFVTRDSLTQVYLKFYVQDLTLFVKTQMELDEEERNRQQVLQKKASLESSILEKFEILSAQNIALSAYNSINLIVSVEDAITERKFVVTPKDSLGNEIESEIPRVEEENISIRLYNSIVTSLKEDIQNYRLTLQEIEVIESNLNNLQKIEQIKENNDLEPPQALNNTTLNAIREEE